MYRRARRSLKADDYVVGFDSAAAMLRALGGFLNDRDFPAIGSLPASLEFAAKPMMNGAANPPAPCWRRTPNWCCITCSIPIRTA